MELSHLDQLYPLFGPEDRAGPLAARLGSQPELQLSLETRDRAQGCLLGQLAGDSLGSLVEFQSAEAIRARYPQGVRDLTDGGQWDTLAGQPTDDSELALILARAIVRHGGYDQGQAAVAYAHWFLSSPFDLGNTTALALRPAAEAVRRGATPQQVAAVATNAANTESQANGALMRVSPLGIFSFRDPRWGAELACRDAELTHPHPVCRAASAAFVAAIATGLSPANGPDTVYQAALETAAGALGHPDVHACLVRSEREVPSDYYRRQGWVLIALGNAFWQLLHAPSLEDGICDTVMRGGDTDTNAAIAGALLGAVHGAKAVPQRWRDRILDCRPAAGLPGVRRPRPRVFWPADALALADALLSAGGSLRGSTSP